MRQTGLVISSDSEHALIQIIRQSACGGNCKSCSGSCSSMGFLISAFNPINAKIGEIVYVDSETNKIMKTAALFYIFPLVVIIIGIVVSKLYLFPNYETVFSDVIALIIGAALYTFSLFLIKLISKNKKVIYTISRKF